MSWFHEWPIPLEERLGQIKAQPSHLGVAPDGRDKGLLEGVASCAASDLGGELIGHLPGQRRNKTVGNKRHDGDCCLDHRMPRSAKTAARSVAAVAGAGAGEHFPELKSLATGMARDYAAVEAGLRLPYSTGQSKVTSIGSR